MITRRKLLGALAGVPLFGGLLSGVVKGEKPFFENGIFPKMMVNGRILGKAKGEYPRTSGSYTVELLEDYGEGVVLERHSDSEDRGCIMDIIRIDTAEFIEAVKSKGVHGGAYLCVVCKGVKNRL